MNSLIYYLYKIITNKNTGFIATCIKCALYPLSWLYFWGIEFYEILFRIGLIKTKELPCQVVSIGNIVVGGTGKTPAAIEIAKILINTGRKPAILLRGYRSQIDSDWAVVSNGEKILISSEQAGDEAYMVAKELPGIPVLIGKKRYRTGYEAIKQYGVDVVILDDGFQHRELKRDIDIVVIDAKQPFGTGRLLPAGTMREPVKALSRADLVMLTRVNQGVNLPELRKRIRQYAPDAKIIETLHQPECLFLIGKHEPIPIEFLEGKKVLAVCGIGNPESFSNTLLSLGVSKIELLPFKDHHRYSKDDIKRIFRKKRKSDSEIIVTTKKDEQKLLAFLQKDNEWSNNTPYFTPEYLYILSIKLKMLTGQDYLRKLLNI